MELLDDELDVLEDELDVLDDELDVLDEALELLDELLLDELELLEVPPQPVSTSAAERIASSRRPVSLKFSNMCFSLSE